MVAVYALTYFQFIFGCIVIFFISYFCILCVVKRLRWLEWGPQRDPSPPHSTNSHSVGNTAFDRLRKENLCQMIFLNLKVFQLNSTTKKVINTAS